MRQIVQTLLSNAVFLATLVVAAQWEIGWLRLLVIGFVWFMLAVYLLTLASADTRKRFRARTEPCPTVIAAAVDAAALTVMIHAGWTITAAAYALSAAILIALYGRHRLFAWTIGR